MITLDNFKTLLDIDLNDTDYDNLLNNILNSAIVFVENECNLKLSVVEVEDLYILKGSNIIALYSRPLIEIMSAKYTSNLVSGEFIDVVDNIDVLDIEESIVLLNNNNKGYLKIKYRAGYNSIPSDLEYAIYQIAIKMYSLSSLVKNGVSRVSSSEGNFTIDFSLVPKGVVGILDKYRRYSV